MYLDHKFIYLMSNSKFNLTNSKYTFNGVSLLVGQINVSTVTSEDIVIPAQAPNEVVHIVLQKNDDNLFKSYISVAPVRPIDVNIYDQNGQYCCKYDKKRTMNASGTLSITCNTKNLLSNILLPTVETGQTYLVLSSYLALGECYMQSSKKMLIEQDLQQLSAKTDLKKVVLFITNEILKQINDLGIDLNLYFKKVYNSPGNVLLLYMIEFLLGKNISSSKPSFQGMLNFGTDTEVILSRFKTIDGQSHITNQIRRNGRIQLNTEDKLCGAYFCIMFKNSDPTEIKFITEETTNTQFEVNDNLESMTDLTPQHFNYLIDGITFLQKLTLCENKTEDLKKVILENLLLTSVYLYDSPLVAFLNLTSQSELSTLIIEHGNSLQLQLFNILYSYAVKLNTSSHNGLPLLPQKRYNGQYNYDNLPIPEMKREVSSFVYEK